MTQTVTRSLGTRTVTGSLVTRGTSFTPRKGTILFGITRFGYPVCAL